MKHAVATVVQIFNGFFSWKIVCEINKRKKNEVKQLKHVETEALGEKRCSLNGSHC